MWSMINFEKAIQEESVMRQKNINPTFVIWTKWIGKVLCFSKMSKFLVFQNKLNESRKCKISNYQLSIK